MTERNLYEVTGDIKDINTMLVSREEWNRRAQPQQAEAVRWCPDVCPITGKPFFMWIGHPKHGEVPTYGGPYDSYTIPVRHEDGSFCCERYDHDNGWWVADEVHDVGVQIVSDQAYVSDEAPQQAEVVSQLTRDFPAVQQSRAVVERQTERYRELMGDDVKNTLKQPQYEAGDMASAHNDGFRAGVASVAQQPHEIEVQCPVCNHKFYEWPNDQQPQAEAVPKDHPLYVFATEVIHGAYRYTELPAKAKAAIAAQGEKP